MKREVKRPSFNPHKPPPKILQDKQRMAITQGNVHNETNATSIYALEEGEATLAGPFGQSLTITNFWRRCNFYEHAALWRELGRHIFFPAYHFVSCLSVEVKFACDVCWQVYPCLFASLKFQSAPEWSYRAPHNSYLNFEKWYIIWNSHT